MIDARGLLKTYARPDGRIDAVNCVDLHVEEGEFLAIVGSSGSGKSTLMNLLGLLDRPDAGEYILNGANTRRLSDKKLSSLRNGVIGFVFQSYNLVPRLSAAENVELGLVFRGLAPAAREKRALEALSLVGLADRRGHLPSQMSGGQQQRVAVARAIAGEPKLILADEPTGNLDSSSAAQVMKILRELNAGGVTVLLITHDREIAANAGRVIQIHSGKIIGDSRQKFI